MSDNGDGIRFVDTEITEGFPLCPACGSADTDCVIDDLFRCATCGCSWVKGDELSDVVLHDGVEPVNLGPCCGCGKIGPDVRNAMMLHYKAPVPGTGWGCFVCGLPADGAVAVLCDKCLEQMRIEQVCKGYPGNGERVPAKSLTEPFEHNLELHGEAPA